jgi:DNA-directed RNA polymerase subunit M/transcription elongation factor TFIIS
MDNFGPAGDFLRVSEHYRGLSDDELLDLARQPSELTDMAQQALANEMSHRGLQAPPREESRPARREVWTPPEVFDPNDPYAEDRELVTLCTVWSLADAFQLQNLLDTAGIPFFMGLEKATSADAVTSNFAAGVEVRVMSIGIPWARKAMQNYAPVNDQTPPEEKGEEKQKEADDELSVQCPKCHSTEVVLEDTMPGSADKPLPQIYKWVCDSCGRHWEDDGVLKQD